MATRKRSFIKQVSQNAPDFLRKLDGERVYLLIENRSPNSVYMQYDNTPAADGTEGIEIVAGFKYEVWAPFAPANEQIYFIGSNGATLQRLNITEGYR
jgi:hypothetical protein